MSASVPFHSVPYAVPEYNPIQSNPIQSNPIQSNPIQSDPVKREKVMPRSIVSCILWFSFPFSPLIFLVVLVFPSTIQQECRWTIWRFSRFPEPIISMIPAITGLIRVLAAFTAAVVGFHDDPTHWSPVVYYRVEPTLDGRYVSSPSARSNSDRIITPSGLTDPASSVQPAAQPTCCYPPHDFVFGMDNST